MEATREMKGKRLVCWLDIRESLNEGRRSDGPFVPAPHVAFSTKRAAAFACLVCGSQTKLLERTGTYLHSLYESQARRSHLEEISGRGCVRFAYWNKFYCYGYISLNPQGMVASRRRHGIDRLPDLPVVRCSPLLSANHCPKFCWVRYMRYGT